ncbi:MAG: hypothetical protein LLF76_12190 [Planctomycetaceae bacterium]|nr:hypothetical protein [Planctomycetaceae bacterium]
MAGNSTILKTACCNLEQSVRRLKLKDHLSARLLGPKEKIELALNPILPCGKGIHVKAFISHHNDALGPAKGGIRMAKDVTCDDIAVKRVVEAVEARGWLP